MIILAAGQGTRLRPLTDDRPKCLVELAGKPLLKWQIETARAAGIQDIVVIGGYRIDQLNDYGATVVANLRFADTNMVRTLFSARELFGDGFIMSYGDIVYSVDTLKRLLAASAPVNVVVDGAWRSYWEKRFDDPLSDAETLAFGADGQIADIGQKPKRIEDVQAQYIGLVAFRSEGVRALTDAYDAAEADEREGRVPFSGERELDRLYMTDLLRGLIGRGTSLSPVVVNGGWVEIDSVRDLAVAEQLVTDGRLAH